MSISAASRKNLSLDRLVNFAAVVSKGGIAAVTGDDVSRQAMISRQIGELASHFGVELTRRSGRGIAFTPEGVRLAAMVNEFTAGLGELRSSIQGSPVCYSIAASNSALHWLFLPNLEKLSGAMPSMKWALHHESAAATCEKVTMGQVDFGLCIGHPGEEMRECRFLGTVEY